MARQVAFAMLLPTLSEEQEKMVYRYGKEHCQEIRIIKRDDGVDVIADATLSVDLVMRNDVLEPISVEFWAVPEP